MSDDETPKEDLFSTGKFDIDATERYSRTGRFRRIRSKPPNPSEMDEPTQKIIVFPVEESYRSEGKAPQAQDTTALPLITHLEEFFPEHLPKDFLEEEELEIFGREDSTRLDFSKEERRLSDIIRSLEDKASQYAENLFVHEDKTDWEEVERIERLIPGTDQEEGKRIAPSRQVVKLPKIRPAPPDIPLEELEEKLNRFQLLRSFRFFALIVLFLPAFAVTFMSLSYSGDLTILTDFSKEVELLGYLLLMAMVLSSDFLVRGLWRSFLLKPGLDTLGLFLGIFCGLDCFIQSSSQTPRGQYPYAAVVILLYIFLAYGEDCKNKAHATACSVASKVKVPHLLIVESQRWNKENVFTKCSSAPHGFASQIQEDDGVQNFYAIVGPIFLVLGFLFSWRLTRNIEDFVWAFSAFLLMSCPFGATMVYGRGSKRVAKRLKSDLYSALAGWPGIAPKCRHCVVGDLDLFPSPFVRITGTTTFQENSEKKVVSYTAAFLRQGEVGCSQIFQDMMQSRQLTYPSTREIRYHDAGGISGKIGLDSVTVGGASFTELMNVKIPSGLFVNQGIFCSINGKLAGFFAMEYSLHEMVGHSLENMIYEGVRPVLSTRDFALTPEILKRRFSLPTGKMDFPTVTRRRELSSTERGEEGKLTAVLIRGGVEAVADAAIAAKRLRQAILSSLGICLLSSFLGFCLVAYLVASTAYSALSPDNLLIYLLLFLAPVWIICDGV
ncbi:MAG: hypothetical protein R3Y63_01690 [Eubacteriales bacterium]